MKAEALPDLSRALHTHVQVLNQSLNHRQLFVLCASISSCSNPTWVIHTVAKAMKRAKSSSVIVTGHRGAIGRRGLHHRQGLPPLYEDWGDRQNGTRQQMSHKPLMQKKKKKMPDSREENVQQAIRMATYYIHSLLSPTVVPILFSGRAALRCFYVLRGKKGRKSLCERRRGGIVPKLSTWQTLYWCPPVWSVFYKNIGCDSVERIPPPRPSGPIYRHQIVVTHRFQPLKYVWHQCENHMKVLKNALSQCLKVQHVAFFSLRHSKMN